MEVKAYSSADNDSITYAVKMNRSEILSENVLVGIVREIARLIAEKYIAENYPQIIAKIDQQAIANLVIAESGKKIAEEIRLTPPEPTTVKHNHHWSLF